MQEQEHLVAWIAARDGGRWLWSDSTGRTESVPVESREAATAAMLTRLRSDGWELEAADESRCYLRRPKRSGG
jgi:hypothetical protein